jgi:hypothetical protein
MQGKHDEDGLSAMQIALRFFGLSGKPNVAPWKLAAGLIVAGAAVLAVAPRHSIAIYMGALLWLAGAGIAIGGWMRLQRLRPPKSN